MTPSVVPGVLEGWMRPFRGHFTAAVWRHGLVLVCGALLAPGRRTVAAALRVMGLGGGGRVRRLPSGAEPGALELARPGASPPAAAGRRLRAGRPRGDGRG